MRRKRSVAISILCVIFIYSLFSNYRISNYMDDDIIGILNDKNYGNPVELKNFSVYGQLYSYSCGPTTMSMVYSFLEKTKSEKELLKELKLESRKSGMLPNTFLKYIRESMKNYDITLKNNIPDSEVLKLIYSQLQKGIPVPTYFSTINDWDKPNYDTHFSAITGIDMNNKKIVLANAYGFREEVDIESFLNSLKYKNYKKMPLYLVLSTHLGIIKKNNIYIISKKY